MRGDRVRLLAGLLLTSALLTGCTVAPPGTTAPPPTTALNIETLLAQAQNADGTQAAQLRLLAARLAEQQGDSVQARAILDPIDPRPLQSSLRYEIARLQATAALAQQDPNAALGYLNPGLFTELSPTQDAELSRLRAEAYERQNNPLGAALELIRVAQNQTEENQRITHERIWSLLQKTDLETLLAAGFNNYGFYEQGWIELALSLKSGREIATQRAALMQWQQLWDTHPAYQNPPPSLLVLLNTELLSAQKVLVALPFSGPLARPAQMIADGILTARYLQIEQGRPAPELISLDTEQLSSAADLMDYAREVQADLVLGPLKPELIDQLASLGTLPIPTIAFNKTELTAEKLYQIDLSSDLEVEQLVEYALAQGAQRLAIIAPSALWGQRIKQDYLSAIEALGAQPVASLDYDPSADLSGQISQLLNTDLSQARYKEVRRLLGQRVEFDERPRRDIDAILMTAEPLDARQIKPMLAYHFAGNYPVYASSHLFEGDPNATRDIDLNGIQFPDLPWTLDPENPLRAQLEAHRSDTRTRLGRLYALGADAFEIHPYLPQMASTPDLVIQGHTGTLNMNEQNRILRQLTWAQFKQGVPLIAERVTPAEPLETLSND